MSSVAKRESRHDEMRREIWRGGWVVTHAGLKTIHGANQDEDFPRGTIDLPFATE